MKILDRYIAQEFLKAFLLAEASFTGIYVIVDLFEKLNRFIEAEASQTVVLSYYFFSLPGIALQVVPVAVLLAALLSLGNLARHNELLAMKMGKVSSFRLVRPPLLLAALLATIAFGLGETAIPRASEKALDLYRTKIKKIPPHRLTRERGIWYRASRDRFLHIALLEASSGTMRGVTVYELNPDFTPSKRIVAKKASWEGGRWSLEDGYIFQLAEGGMAAAKRFAKLPLDLQERPEELAGVMRLPQEMNIRELSAYIRKLRQSGIDATRYMVDLHAKGASAFAILVMAIIGAAFGLKVGRGGIMVWAGACIPLGFVYWVLLSVGFAFGRSGLLPPFLAAWLPNLFFTLGGIISFARFR